MDLFLQGLLIGATLTVMIGPITFTIVDASLTAGISYGIVTAVGMWCSDLLYIFFSYYGAQQLQEAIRSEEMTRIVSIVGGFVLITIGYVIWRTRNIKPHTTPKNKILYYSGHWFRGFVVNTFAPFSLIFWPTVTLTFVIPNALSDSHASGFYFGVLTSIIIGDTLKSSFAGWISHRISSKTTMQIRVGIAVLFVVAGLLSLGRLVWEVI